MLVPARPGGLGERPRADTLSRRRPRADLETVSFRPMPFLARLRRSNPRLPYFLGQMALLCVPRAVWQRRREALRRFREDRRDQNHRRHKWELI